jgi:iron complex transport system substrate-binding protein
MKFVNCVLIILLVLIAARVSLYAERVVTLAPALTEMVFALGKGDQVVGNTKFCNFPGEAKKITRVGGLIDNHSGLETGCDHSLS